MTPVFIATIPVSSDSAIRVARFRLVVNTYAAKPTSLSLALVMTSCSVLNLKIAATGPNVSSLEIRIVSSTLVRIVGSTKLGPTYN